MCAAFLYGWPPKSAIGEPGPLISQVIGDYGKRGTRCRHQAAMRRNTNDALVPPNPNEFDRTRSMSRLFDWCGTRSMGVSTDGLSRLMVGGATRSRMARIEKIASTAPAAPNRRPGADLLEDMLTRPAALPSKRCTAASSISSPIGVEVPWALM